jgi:hypothetical protein
LPLGLVVKTSNAREKQSLHGALMLLTLQLGGRNGKSNCGMNEWPEELEDKLDEAGILVW